ncbi:hypothetical protein WN73_14355 [Bradyrhizobium sp. CCBAU 45394]|uniref:DUF6894 family protein n=1 Tax=Bradyrhizobium sp. CCBAU 45394 TaxID=1325087 RepID=UPI0023031EAE|nr:hypothetical protein [Bradyrhizobium sp. CCBAU 45394]MDA9391785.1 hypothetical protein [Bradyrhizobium sp. CCBAU 45394]
MRRYYFDIRDGSQFIRDDEGVELPHVEAAREEATTALSEMAREWVRNRPHHRMAVEVRDDHGPILQASFSFAMKPSRASKAFAGDGNAIVDAD